MSKEETEVREEISWISGEYLSYAAGMVAIQIIDNKMEFEDVLDFELKVDYLMRQHAPIAYSYLFQNSQGTKVLPQGTYDIVLKYIRRAFPMFLGGEHSGIILPN